MPNTNDGQLDRYERTLEDNLEAWEPLPPAERERLLNALKGGSVRKPVTVRIDVRDIDALKRLAQREGLPYQSLLGSIVHKYVTGILVDVDEARKLLRGA